MKKFGKLFLAVFVAIFSSITIVNAASKCDYNEQVELNNAAANIKASYEEAEGKLPEEKMVPSESGELPKDTFELFRLSIYNLTEDFYLKITNDYNNEVKYLYYQNSESGVVTYDWENLEKVTNFTIMVYSTNNTGCPNEEYRVIYLTTPRLNPYVYEAGCTDNEDFYLCSKYINETKDIDEEEFYTELEKFENNKEVSKEEKVEENNSWSDKVSEFISENKITIIVISTIIVIGGAVATVIVIKKRRSRLI